MLPSGPALKDTVLTHYPQLEDRILNIYCPSFHINNVTFQQGVPDNTYIPVGTKPIRRQCFLRCQLSDAVRECAEKIPLFLGQGVHYVDELKIERVQQTLQSPVNCLSRAILLTTQPAQLGELLDIIRMVVDQLRYITGNFRAYVLSGITETGGNI